MLNDAAEILKVLNKKVADFEGSLKEKEDAFSA